MRTRFVTAPSPRALLLVHLMSALVASTLVSGCATRRGGGRRQRVYVAPSGEFSVRIPGSIFGTRVEDGRNEKGSWVHFSSDDGSVWRIEYYPIPEDSKAAAGDSFPDAFVEGFFTDVMVRDFQAAAPGTTVLHSGFVEDSLGRAFHGVVRIPGGSSAVQMTADGPRPLDAIMHNLLFRKGERFYVLKVVVGEMGLNRENPDLSAERALSFRRLITFR